MAEKTAYDRLIAVLERGSRYRSFAMFCVGASLGVIVARLFPPTSTPPTNSDDPRDRELADAKQEVANLHLVLREIGRQVYAPSLVRIEEIIRTCKQSGTSR